MSDYLPFLTSNDVNNVRARKFEPVRGFEEMPRCSLLVQSVYAQESWRRVELPMSGAKVGRANELFADLMCVIGKLWRRPAKKFQGRT